MELKKKEAQIRESEARNHDAWNRESGARSRET